MPGAETEKEYLEALAERPFDRSLRLVFSDWLLERGDARGEAIALGEKGELSLTERRKLQRLTEQHAREWLGPLAAIADLHHTRWEAGFVTELACQPTSAEAWNACTGDPRLATVKNLSIPASRDVPRVDSFLRHPRLRHLERLQAGSGVWMQLDGPGAKPAFALTTAALMSWGTFGAELRSVASNEVLKSAKVLELVTSEFVNPIVAQDIREAALSNAALLRHFRELRLGAQYGVIEGVVSWLLTGASERLLETHWPGTSWSIVYGEIVFQLQRNEGGRFERLVVDASGHEIATGLGSRLATAAGVLVQLAPARLVDVSLVLPAGAGVRNTERDALRAAVRRLGTVHSFTLGGHSLSP